MGAGKERQRGRGGGEEREGGEGGRGRQRGRGGREGQTEKGEGGTDREGGGRGTERGQREGETVMHRDRTQHHLVSPQQKALQTHYNVLHTCRPGPVHCVIRSASEGVLLPAPIVSPLGRALNEGVAMDGLCSLMEELIKLSHFCGHERQW